MAYVNLLDLVYPVGSIYMSMIDSSPAEFIGGDWEKIQDRFLLATGDYNKWQSGVTAGEFEHTLINEELPYHWHWVGNRDIGDRGYSGEKATGGCRTEPQIEGTGDSAYGVYTWSGRDIGRDWICTSFAVDGHGWGHISSSASDPRNLVDMPHNNTPPLHLCLYVAAQVLSSLAEVM